MSRARSWRQIIFAATLCVASLAVAAPALAEIEIPASASSYFQDPAFKPAFEAEQQRLKDLWERRTSPEGQRALEHSASAYADLSAAAAVELATDEHAETLAEPTFDPLAGQPASEIEGFTGDYGAVVDVPDESSNALVESTLPMQAETPSGELEAVDNELDDTGAVLEPENPLAGLDLPAEVSQDAQDAIELPDIDVAIAPEGVSGSPEADVVAGRAFYANAYTDSDFIAGPVAGGFESLYQLRSANSPESFQLAFDLPEGAELVQQSDGVVQQGDGAAIVRDGEELATIAPPLAWDSDGVRAPVSYRVEGDSLVIEVSHRDSDWAYPILVDPTVTESFSAAVDFSEWIYAENDYDFVDYRPTSGGLYVIGGYPYGHPPDGGLWAHYPYLSQANWSFSAPGTQSRIYKTTYANVQASSPLLPPYDLPFHWVMEGLATSSGSWQNGRASFDPGGGGGGGGGGGFASPYVQGGNIPYPQTLYHCIDATLPYCEDYGTINDNSAVIMSFANPGGNTWYTGFSTFMGGASVSIADTTLPTMGTLTHTYEDASGVHSGLPSGWVDDVDLTLRSQARDLGLGVKTFKLTVPGLPLQTRTVACSGDRSDRCPNTGYYSSHATGEDAPTGNNFYYSTAAGQPQIPEGDNTLSASAVDLLGNQSANSTWHVKVDRSAPVVTLSGPLKQADTQGGTLSNDSYELDISATDGNPSGSSNQKRSGVRSIEVLVDGQSVYASPQQACPASSCPMSDEWVFYTQDYAPGTHTVQVVARDQLGHPGPSEVLEFETAHPSFPDDDTEPEVTVEAGPPSGGTYQLTIEASDEDSGVRQMKLFVDGVSVNSFSQPCASGGCPMTRTVTMQHPSQSPAGHEIAVEVEDGAENSRFGFEGKMTTKPEHFGYNDDFVAPFAAAEQRLQQAIDGGADTVRFSIDWCSLAQIVEGDPANPNPAQPATWRWWIYDPIFQKLRMLNSDSSSTNDLDVIAVLGDSPAWANAASAPRAEKCPIDGPDESDGAWTPPDANHYSSWRAFVDKFLELYGAPDNGIVAIEAWNEPNLRKFWGETSALVTFYPDPQKFGHLVDRAGKSLTAYNDAHPGQPRIKLVPGALSPDGVEITVGEFMRQAVSPSDDNLINPGEVDAVSIHLYANRHRKTQKVKAKFLDKYTEIANAFNQPTVGLGSKPQWITEIGVPSRHGFDQGSPDPNKTNPNKQWHRLEWAYLEFSKESYPLIDTLLVHRLLDPIFPAGTPNPEPNNFGMMDNTFHARFAYCMLIMHETETSDPLPIPDECQ